MGFGLSFIKFRVRVGAKVRMRVHVRFGPGMRVGIRVRFGVARISVAIRVKFRVRVGVGVRVRAAVGFGVGTKVLCLVHLCVAAPIPVPVVWRRSGGWCCPWPRWRLLGVRQPLIPVKRSRLTPPEEG